MLRNAACSLREAELHNQVKQLGGHGATVEEMRDSACAPDSGRESGDRRGSLDDAIGFVAQRLYLVSTGAEGKIAQLTWNLP